ncbi:MAG TPA: GDYXXLXY domain-containing protein [Cryomorphaceae bacterium]|nr:GDYXXLXY domain-containing protein [Cryomorphaceae bacterium]
MTNKKVLIPIFVMMVMAQLFVPFQMVFTSEGVIADGTEFKLKTQPYDPKDPFRGNYVRLNFEISRYTSPDSTGWKKGEPVYVILRENTNGFGEILRVIQFEPGSSLDYLEATLSNFYQTDSGTELVLDFPFERFYMQEEKAPIAERIYNRSTRDSTKQTYALVSVREGEAILRDVQIDGVSLSELAAQELVEKGDASETQSNE